MIDVWGAFPLVLSPCSRDFSPSSRNSLQSTMSKIWGPSATKQQKPLQEKGSQCLQSTCLILFLQETAFPEKGKVAFRGSGLEVAIESKFLAPFLSGYSGLWGKGGRPEQAIFGDTSSVGTGSLAHFPRQIQFGARRAVAAFHKW